MTIRSLLKFSFGVTAAFFLAASNQAQAIQFDFASVGKGGGATAKAATLRFNGTAGADTFTFVDATGTTAGGNQNAGFDFLITTVTGGVGDAANLRGKIGGTFTIGAATIHNPIAQSAPVTGTGTFSIADGLGKNLTASITFTEITTLGTTGGFNGGATINLTNVVYTGTRLDLLEFALSGEGMSSIAFTFSTPKSVTQLKATGVNSTSYSGEVHTLLVPDGGSTVAFLGMGLAGIEGLRRRLAARKSLKA
ncbi:MAG: VPDSG-CTERM sorting domain-containing protein [Verrucomicrobiota bacterium]